MTDKYPDGGYAFPEGEMQHQTPTGYQRQLGMTLRDWFAGQSVSAAQEIAIGYMPASNPKFQENVAHHAYALADALIACSNQPQ